MCLGFKITKIQTLALLLIYRQSEPPTCTVPTWDYTWGTESCKGVLSHAKKSWGVRTQSTLDPLGEFPLEGEPRGRIGMK